MKAFSSLALIIFIAISASAQQSSISGNISDASSGKHISNSHITVYKLPEYELLYQVISSNDGSYKIPVTVNSEVLIHISHIGYSLFEKRMTTLNKC
jgi:hypothetical protein